MCVPVIVIGEHNIKSYVIVLIEKLRKVDMNVTGHKLIEKS